MAAVVAAGVALMDTMFFFTSDVYLREDQGSQVGIFVHLIWKKLKPKIERLNPRFIVFSCIFIDPYVKFANLKEYLPEFIADKPVITCYIYIYTWNLQVMYNF